MRCSRADRGRINSGPGRLTKSGASSLAIDVLTASAKLLSARSAEPRQAATAQWIGLPLQAGGRSCRARQACAIWRAAEAISEYSANIIAVTDWRVVGKPARPRRMATLSDWSPTALTWPRHSANCCERHEHGCPSVALEQAFAFKLGVRQKDVCHWRMDTGHVARSDVILGPRKRLRACGRMISMANDPVAPSQQVEAGQAATVAPKGGKLKALGLKDDRVIIDELRHVTGKGAVYRRRCLRSHRPTVGRIRFARMWRIIATEAGIPANIQNRAGKAG
jgi:hypothetical protein